MDLKLKGKRALVTGSTAGIGYAIAIPISDHTQLPVAGQEVLLFTSFVIRENSAVHESHISE